MTVQLRIAATDLSVSTTDSAVCESRPDVGSSKKMIDGKWMMSTPILT